jgi:hypothetical protein
MLEHIHISRWSRNMDMDKDYWQPPSDFYVSTGEPDEAEQQTSMVLNVRIKGKQPTASPRS